MSIIEVNQLIVDSISGDISRGGWEASCSFMNAQSYADYSRRAEIFHLDEGAGVWGDEWLLGIRGFILPQQIVWDRGQSATEITLSTSNYFLNRAAVQGIFFSTPVVDVNNPHQAAVWTLGKIVKHIIEEHTNVTDWVDDSGIDTTDSTSVNVYTVKESESIWDSIKRIGENEFYVPYFTKKDEFIYKVHPMFAVALPEPVMEIDYRYIIGQPVVTYLEKTMYDQVQLYALTDEGAILQSFFPANIGSDGRRYKQSNIRCNSQPRLDTLAQRLSMYLRKQFDVQLTMPGAWGLNMELYDRIELTYNGTARNGVDFAWNQKKFWIKSIQVRRQFNFGAVTELQLEEESYEEGYFYSDYTT